MNFKVVFMKDEKNLKESLFWCYVEGMCEVVVFIPCALSVWV